MQFLQSHRKNRHFVAKIQIFYQLFFNIFLRTQRRPDEPHQKVRRKHNHRDIQNLVGVGVELHEKIERHRNHYREGDAYQRGETASHGIQ